MYKIILIWKVKDFNFWTINLKKLEFSWFYNIIYFLKLQKFIFEMLDLL